ncbi:HAD hydrolase family protein [Mycobacterium sp. 4D054]|uniref:HAD hydrolase family protein n=1 Tax=unclassified Mycobacterium TaxID=2642494 RepID=UPI0021B3E53C|nr:HAD hydrolase family protein [Mycobacterium sp. SMC-8]UXA14730.1 HAD hydrolase family protein [Mycobacterium sp. SMC-8]
MAFYKVVATDIDGTLTSAGELSSDALRAIRRARDRGLSIVFVTGRIGADLYAEFPGIAEHADALVLENGAMAVIDGREVALSAPVESALDTELTRRCIPFRRGAALIAGDGKHAAEVVEAIGMLGLDCQIVRNREALMVLPAGVTKGSGLHNLLTRMNRSLRNTIAIGDAENDLSMMAAAEMGVAVVNAVASVKAHADVVIDGRDGKGVARLLDGPIVSGARRWCPMRRWIDIGVFEDQTPARLPGSQGRIVVTGPPGSGKSHLIGLMAEQWILAGYGVLVVDPEGDHTELRDLDSVVLVDSRRHLLEPPDLVEMLHPRTSLVVDLSALNAAAKSGYIHRLRAVVEAHREQYGFPHWVIWDEAHLLGPQQEVRWVRRGGYVLSSFAPATLPADEVDASDVVVETLSPEGAEAAPWPVARAVIRHGGGRPRCFTVAGRRTSHIRHRHKYADVALPQERRFYFQPTDGQAPAPAATMREFGEAMIRLAPETLRFHLERGDFSRWLRHTIADAELAAEVASWEDELAAHHAAEAERIRTRISHAVQKRYLEAPG